METVADAVNMALILSIQMGMPVAILFLIGYRNYQAERRKQGHRNPEAAIGCIGAPSPDLGPSQGGGLHCWDLKGCPSSERASCPAHSHAEMACWQAKKLTHGRLQDRCLDCERFLAPPMTRSGRSRKGGYR